MTFRRVRRVPYYRTFARAGVASIISLRFGCFGSERKPGLKLWLHRRDYARGGAPASARRRLFAHSGMRRPLRRVKAKQSFREFQAARRTIDGYEAMHMIRKGHARWVSDDDVRKQNQFIDQLFDLAACDFAAQFPSKRC